MNLYSMIASKELRLCDDARQRASIHTDRHKQPAAVLRGSRQVQPGGGNVSASNRPEADFATYSRAAGQVKHRIDLTRRGGRLPWLQQDF